MPLLPLTRAPTVDALAPTTNINSHNPLAVTGAEAREAPPPDPTSVFGVFDGHGGAFTSTFVANSLGKCLQETPAWKSGDRYGNVMAKVWNLCPRMYENIPHMFNKARKRAGSPRTIVVHMKQSTARSARHHEVEGRWPCSAISAYVLLRVAQVL